MKKSKLSETQIIALLKEGESGVTLDEICRKYAIARSTYYKLKDKYGGMEQTDLKRLRQLEAENSKLKHMYADACLDNKILRDVIEKKLKDR